MHRFCSQAHRRDSNSVIPIVFSPVVGKNNCFSIMAKELLNEYKLERLNEKMMQELNAIEDAKGSEAQGSGAQGSGGNDE